MMTPHDAWEFGWSKTYDERFELIQSLPEEEKVWVAFAFKHFDQMFTRVVKDELQKAQTLGLPSDQYNDLVNELRDRARLAIEPKEVTEYD